MKEWSGIVKVDDGFFGAACIRGKVAPGAGRWDIETTGFRYLWAQWKSLYRNYSLLLCPVPAIHHQCIRIHQLKQRIIIKKLIKIFIIFLDLFFFFLHFSYVFIRFWSGFSCWKNKSTVEEKNTIERRKQNKLLNNSLEMGIQISEL